LERHDDSRGRGRKPFRAASARPRRDRKLRKAFFSRAAELTPYLAVEADEALFFVATDDAGIGRRLFVNGIRGDMAHLGTGVRVLEELGVRINGSTFVDVGANIGTTTVTALRRYGFARAVALEPAPSNFLLLRLNLVANEVESNVTALQVAVTDREGEEQLVLSGASSGSHVLAPVAPVNPSSMVMVQAVTLDGLVARDLIDPAAVGLLWIDAAGNEIKALAGAAALVSAGVPLIVALRTRSETWPEDKECLLRLLAGYTDFADLRLEARAQNLGDLLDSIERPATDLLAVRRPRTE
jgi:FkbM family methyltransferase